MIVRICLLFILFMLVPQGWPLASDGSGVAVSGAPEVRVAVFASQRVRGSWTESGLSSFRNGALNFNECENAIQRGLLPHGVNSDFGEIDAGHSGKLLGLRTVVARYKDISTMPNDTAVRAARALDGSAQAVITCRAREDDSGEKNGSAANGYCARASCKAIDTHTAKRFVIATGSKCVVEGDAKTARAAALEGVCLDMGGQMGARLADYFIKR